MRLAGPGPGILLAMEGPEGAGNPDAGVGISGTFLPLPGQEGGQGDGRNCPLATCQDYARKIGKDPGQGNLAGQLHYGGPFHPATTGTIMDTKYIPLPEAGTRLCDCPVTPPVPRGFLLRYAILVRPQTCLKSPREEKGSVRLEAFERGPRTDGVGSRVPFS